ncbi:hypothetical protein OE88DRAFT_1661878 [Heliocybe sulcata]|uniref:Uncharacterized protein n=1 Tax=Heliocybe sulcata TaxID=5364 RepID=A0A5C3MXG6_9AGAM|nr:hypothetical protein OE88DRAFT_1661878 [Heliocybe sulcata]
MSARIWVYSLLAGSHRFLVHMNFRDADHRMVFVPVVNRLLGISQASLKSGTCVAFGTRRTLRRPRQLQIGSRWPQWCSVRQQRSSILLAAATVTWSGFQERPGYRMLYAIRLDQASCFVSLLSRFKSEGGSSVSVRAIDRSFHSAFLWPLRGDTSVQRREGLMNDHSSQTLSLRWSDSRYRDRTNLCVDRFQGQKRAAQSMGSGSEMPDKYEASD